MEDFLESETKKYRARATRLYNERYKPLVALSTQQMRQIGALPDRSEG
jgi:hypothetical protein